jgi:hypothetical protein
MLSIQSGQICPLVSGLPPQKTHFPAGFDMMGDTKKLIAAKPDLDEATLQIAKRTLSMPPKPHKEMKIGKRKAKAGVKANPKKPA